MRSFYSLIAATKPIVLCCTLFMFAFACSDRPEAVDLSFPTQLKSSLGIAEPSQACKNQLQLSNKSLVFTKTNLLKDRFSLEKVLNQIIKTSTNDVKNNQLPGLREELILSMTESFGVQQQTNNLSNLQLPVDSRPSEASISIRDFLRDFKPVAVFNRHDLASDRGADCGEQRIVYSMNDNFTLIFEARIPNPKPNQRASGCLEVTRFWADLENRDLNNTQRADRLEKFFFKGVTRNGVRIQPVVRYQNYRGKFGQVRTNSVLGGPWQLREFRTAKKGGKAVFKVESVKDVPINELYGSSRDKPGGFEGDNRKLNNLRKEFKNNLINVQIDNLIQPELNGANKNQTITGFSVAFDPKFFEFQSTSGSDDVASTITADLEERIRDAIPNGVDLEPRHIVNRLNALTCIGCHQSGTVGEIAPGVNFPDSFFFTHVNDSGNLSPALKDVFLPERKLILESYICSEL